MSFLSAKKHSKDDPPLQITGTGKNSHMKLPPLSDPLTSPVPLVIQPTDKGAYRYPHKNSICSDQHNATHIYQLHTVEVAGSVTTLGTVREILTTMLLIFY